MTRAFAAGRKSFGYCDRCSFRYRIWELREEYKNLEATGLYTCPTCWDGDHPQLQLGRFHFDDPQALRNPRPDNSQQASRYDDTHRWDFETDTESWTGTRGTLAWVSLGDGVSLTPTSGGPRMDSPDSQGIDASEYAYVRALVKLTTDPASVVWKGRIGWTRAASGTPGLANNFLDTKNPGFESMGNQWHLLTWPVKDEKIANWHSTVFQIGMQLTTDADTASLFYVDYITVEKGPVDAS